MEDVVATAAVAVVAAAVLSWTIGGRFVAKELQLSSTMLMVLVFLSLLESVDCPGSKTTKAHSLRGPEQNRSVQYDYAAQCGHINESMW